MNICLWVHYGNKFTGSIRNAVKALFNATMHNIDMEPNVWLPLINRVNMYNIRIYIPRFFWIENSADAPVLTSEKKGGTFAWTS